MVAEGFKVKEILAKNNISAEIINARFLKPLDIETIKNSSKKTGKLVVMECGIASGGIGEGIASYLKNEDVKLMLKNIPDNFVEHGSVSELMKIYRLDGASVAEDIIKELF